jgi:hypothetical protein
MIIITDTYNINNICELRTKFVRNRNASIKLQITILAITSYT